MKNIIIFLLLVTSQLCFSQDTNNPAEKNPGNGTLAKKLSLSVVPWAPCKGGLGAFTISPNGGIPMYSVQITPCPLTAYPCSMNGVSSGFSTALKYPAGTYTITVTDAIGSSVSKTITLTELPALVLSFSISEDCSASSVYLTVTGGTSPFTYSWSTGAITKDLTNVPAGTYTVSVMDYHGCKATSSTSVTTQTCDFGDAKDPTYPTLFNHNGARHVISDLKLGLFVDSENDGQPTQSANGDDMHGSPDEDGVTIPPLHPGINMITFTTTNNLSNMAFLQGWIDFQGSGNWSAAGDQILTNFQVYPGGNFGHYIFTVPSLSSPKMTFARFRLSTMYNLSYTGKAPDGEVEDDSVWIDTSHVNVLDYGDAPDNKFYPIYPTLKAHQGACHFSDCHVRLGKYTDAENDGQPNTLANGDDTHGAPDDEDGVTFPNPFSATNNLITVWPHNYLSANTIVYLNGWIDFNHDHVWDNSSGSVEHIIVNDQILYDGTSCCFDSNHPGTVRNYQVAIPSGAAGYTYARFRISDIPGQGPTQPTSSPITIGEVEDYRVNICCWDTLSPVVVTNTAAYNFVGAVARLNGTVTANNDTATVSFEWGETTSYGNAATATPSKLTGLSPTPVQASISGIVAGKTYHFRCKATNARGTSYGDDAILSCTTLPCPCATGEISVISAGDNLSAALNPQNSELTCYFTINGVNLYKQVRVSVIDFKLYAQDDNGNPAKTCLQCYQNASGWASIVEGAMGDQFSGGAISICKGSPNKYIDNPREVVFKASNYPSGSQIVNESMHIKLTVPGKNPLACCHIFVKIAFKVTFRAADCHECDQIITRTVEIK